ncbi:dimethyladenosine transferase 2, mitochondrial isoform X2 [Panulirus ornatus]
MLALRRLPQKCSSICPVPYLRHGGFRPLSPFGGKEQGTEASTAIEEPSSVDPVIRESKRKIHVRKEKSESIVSQTVLPPKLVTCEGDWSVNDNRKAKDTRVLIKDLKRNLRRNKSGSRWYLLDQDIAKKFVTHLNKGLKESDIIVESSPGPGVLTEILLTQTNNKVIAYEPQDILRSNLEKSLLPRYPSSLQIYDYDLEKFYAHYIIDRKEPEKSILEKFLKPMPIKGDGKDSPVKITGIIHDIKFFFRLILSFAFQCCFYEEIFPDLYLFIPKGIYNRIAFDSENFIFRNISVPFQFYFHLECLEVVSREGFYPPYTQHSKGKFAREKHMHLVKISPNEDIFKEVPKKELISFHYFMNTVSRIKRTETLIMCLEKWIPDCGPQLIKNGLHVFSHPRDLTKEQLLLAYSIFISLPSFEESVFHYQWRQYAARYGEKDEEVPQLNLTEGVSVMEDQELL